MRGNIVVSDTNDDTSVTNSGILHGGSDLPKVVIIQSTCPTPLHLLEVIAAFDIAHEEQALQRLYIRSCCYHVYGHGNARVIVIAKTGQYLFRIILGLIGHLFAELIAFAEFFTHDLDNVIRMAIGFRKNQPAC